MADKSHNQTDKLLEQMEKRISAIYAEAQVEMKKKAEAYFDAFIAEGDRKLKLVKAGKLSEAEYQKWVKNKIAYGKRFDQFKQQYAEAMSHVNEIAAAYINDQLPDIYALNYNGAGEDIASQVGGYSFTMADANTVKNLATRDTTLLPYKYIDGKKDVRWNTQKVNAAITQGILQGESIPNIAKRLSKNIPEMNKASAIRNARTATTGAECAGRQSQYEEATRRGIQLQREWIAAIDMRTRHAHRLLDGQLADVDKPFESELGDIMFPGDPEAHPANVYNCRCTVAAKVLGFEKPNKGFSAGGEKPKIGEPEQIGAVDFSDEKAIMKILSKAEEETVNLPYESSCIVTSDGKVWRIKGDSGSVNPGNIPSSLEGSYSYHNHPADVTWHSFSADDVGFFLEKKQVFSKSSDHIYEYSIKRTRDTIDTSYNSAYNSFQDIFYSEIYKLSYEEKIDIDRDGFHETMKILSQKYKFHYQRKVRNGD